MPLSCNSDDFEPEPGDVTWWLPRDFNMYTGKRATKCASCGKRIAPGDDIVTYRRTKMPEHDIEIAIYGEDGEIPRRPACLCEECGGLALSLIELGFCPAPTDDMRELIAEMHELHRQAAEEERNKAIIERAAGSIVNQAWEAGGRAGIIKRGYAFVPMHLPQPDPSRLVRPWNAGDAGETFEVVFGLNYHTPPAASRRSTKEPFVTGRIGYFLPRKAFVMFGRTPADFIADLENDGVLDLTWAERTHYRSSEYVYADPGATPISESDLPKPPPLAPQRIISLTQDPPAAGLG